MAGETVQNRAALVLETLKEHYGATPWNWHTRQTPFRVLVGTVLSQRTADPKTDEAAQKLFSAYDTPEAIAAAEPEDIERLIRSVNYYRTKARRIRDICRILVERYSGSVPEDVAELIKLPGVGMKTASCVMVYGFGKPAIPVDTHVHRISNRIGLIGTRTPKDTERELWKIIPEEFVLLVNDLMVKHGQTVCRPVKPQCARCPVAALCDYEPKGSSPCASS